MAARLSRELAAAYASLWADLGITHELTISLGIGPKSFSPEEKMMPILRNLVREASRKLRLLPKRRALKLRHDDPCAVMIAGFYEGYRRSGEPFPHWHGGVALRPGEERPFRDLLWQCVGEDAADPLAAYELTRTTRSLVPIPSAKPTFDLKPLKTTARFISYANKNTRPEDVIHWTTADLLA